MKEPIFTDYRILRATFREEEEQDFIKFLEEYGFFKNPGLEGMLGDDFKKHLLRDYKYNKDIISFFRRTPEERIYCTQQWEKTKLEQENDDWQGD